MFRRMVALPYDQYAQMNMSQNLQRVKQPNDVQFNTLEKQYEEQANINDPYRRMLLQGETLDQMKVLKDRMRNMIASSTPKPYRNRAASLFEGLESVAQFNERGEITNDEGKVVPNSNLQDLIQHAVRDRRRSGEGPPTGWSDFVDLLKKRNVPRNMLNRTTLDEMEGKVTLPKTFQFGTPAARLKDESDTAVKRAKPTTNRKRSQPSQRDNAFDVIANFGDPTPKKRRKLPVRQRNKPEKLGFVSQF